ncbi:histone-lysine N-methyltransferase SETMAR [Trichonephila clavipes]|nr:histone-lysine N-methyltransferase SETMAR [Trichonephila clavipes]
MVVSLEHLMCYHDDGCDFLLQTATRNESWVHHFTSEVKVTSMEWKNVFSPVRRKFKATPSAGKAILIVFWEAQGVLLRNFLEVGTINATRYYDNLTISKEAVRKK